MNPGTAVGRSIAEASTWRPRGPNSCWSLMRNPIDFWQCEQYVKMNASTTGWPLYWLNWICLPGARLMAKSDPGRGRLAACAIGATNKQSNAREVGLRIGSSVTQEAEGRRQKAEGRRQKAEGRSQEPEWR